MLSSVLALAGLVMPTWKIGWRVGWWAGGVRS